MAEQLMALAALAFYATIISLVIAETIAPRRRDTASLGRRWLTNIALFLLGQACHRLLVPVSALAVAQAAASEGFGVLSLASLPAVATIALGVLLLDMWKYAEHRLVHAVPLLWRFHSVHHADPDVDFTTAERHHPFETLFAAGGFLLVVFVAGVPPLAVALYVLIAGVVAVLTHANMRLPNALDRALRAAVVTPAVHVIHHSAERRETDSNFGILLTLWDRVFGTYRAPTAAADDARVLGLEYFRDPRDTRLDRVLAQPFSRPWANPHVRADEPPPLGAPGAGSAVS